MTAPRVSAAPTGAVALVCLLATVVLLLNQDNTAPAKPGDQSQPATWVTQWQEETPFNSPRRALAAVATTTHMYVIGGVDNADSYVTAVEFAPFNADGTLGPWQATSSLNEPRFYIAAAVVGDFLFALGGGAGPRGDDNVPSATVEQARILPSGELGPWKRVAYLTTPRRGLKVVAHANTLYALGGYNGTFLRSVERAQVKADGTLMPWRQESELAQIERYIHSAAASESRIYLMAGHVENTGTMGYADVESAPFMADGSLGAWRLETTRLHQPRFIAFAALLGERLYLLGGHDGGARLATTETAALSGNGRVGAWRRTTPLPAPRAGAAAVVANDKLYVLGGSTPNGVENSVLSAALGSAGELGHRLR